MTFRVTTRLQASPRYKVVTRFPVDLDIKLVETDKTVEKPENVSQTDFDTTQAYASFSQVPSNAKFTNTEIITTLQQYFAKVGNLLAIDEISLFDDFDEEETTQYDMRDINFMAILESFERPYRILFPGDKYDGGLDLFRLNIRISKAHKATKAYFG